MKRLLVIIFIAIALCIAASAQTSLKVGSAAPAFAATSMDGTKYDLDDLRGSVVVLTFWSTKCEICHHEFPKVNQLVQDYTSRNVIFLALTMENEAKVNEYIRKNRLTSQIMPNSFGVVLQYADRTRDGSLDMGFPSFFVIDQSGIVQYRSSGFNKTTAMGSAINRLVEKTVASKAIP